MWFLRVLTASSNFENVSKESVVPSFRIITYQLPVFFGRIPIIPKNIFKINSSFKNLFICFIRLILEKLLIKDSSHMILLSRNYNSNKHSGSIKTNKLILDVFSDYTDFTFFQ